MRRWVSDWTLSELVEDWKAEGSPSRKGHVYCFEMVRLSSGDDVLTMGGVTMNKMNPRHIYNSVAWRTLR